MSDVDRHSSPTTAAQRCFDLALTLALLVPMLTLGALIAAAVYLDSPGPVLFRSRRIGAGGRPFMMWKFRKLRHDAHSGLLTLDDDERFTPIGRFLALTRLDELPQLYNVLVGEMRLVGPRPELEDFTGQFPAEYAQILTVTPGITGNAQLAFVNERLLLRGPDPDRIYRDEVLPLKVQIDLAYAREHSLAADLRILARTALLPVALALAALRHRQQALRAWAPAVSAAAALLIVFLVASARLG